MAEENPTSRANIQKMHTRVDARLGAIDDHEGFDVESDYFYKSLGRLASDRDHTDVESSGIDDPAYAEGWVEYSPDEDGRGWSAKFFDANGNPC